MVNVSTSLIAKTYEVILYYYYSMVNKMPILDATIRKLMTCCCGITNWDFGNCAIH